MLVGSTSNRKGVWGGRKRGLVSSEVGCSFALMEGGEKVSRGRREVWRGWDACYLGSSIVERAHNLLNGAWPSWRCGSRGALIKV